MRHRMHAETAKPTTKAAYMHRESNVPIHGPCKAVQGGLSNVRGRKAYAPAGQGNLRCKQIGLWQWPSR